MSIYSNIWILMQYPIIIILEFAIPHISNYLHGLEIMANTYVGHESLEVHRTCQTDGMVSYGQTWQHYLVSTDALR